MTRTTWPSIVGVALIAACSSPPSGPPPIVPKAGEPAPPVVRRPVPEAAAPSTAAPTVPVAPEAPPVVPTGAIYACVVGRTVTAIQFEPKIAALCTKHPEMGPCQYEREECRRSGGRVFAANGKEITRVTEAEYDRKVMRLRFRAD
jgi:hypothetical protein